MSWVNLSNIYLPKAGGGVISGDLTVSGNLTVGGRKLGEQKVLWSGCLYMNADHTITLSEAVSKQPNGIVLVWSYYKDGAATNSELNLCFIPKILVNLNSGAGYQCHVCTNNTVSNKYVSVSDTKIVGTNWNYSGGVNSYFVLTHVLGV